MARDEAAYSSVAVGPDLSFVELFHTKIDDTALQGVNKKAIVNATAAGGFDRNKHYFLAVFATYEE